MKNLFYCPICHRVLYLTVEELRERASLCSAWGVKHSTAGLLGSWDVYCKGLLEPVEP